MPFNPESPNFNDEGDSARHQRYQSIGQSALAGSEQSGYPSPIIEGPPLYTEENTNYNWESLSDEQLSEIKKQFEEREEALRRSIAEAQRGLKILGFSVPVSQSEGSSAPNDSAPQPTNPDQTPPASQSTSSNPQSVPVAGVPNPTPEANSVPAHATGVTAPSPEANTPTTGEATVSPETAMETYSKAKKKPSLKKVIFSKVLPITLALGIGLGTVLGAFGFLKNRNTKSATPSQAGQAQTERLDSAWQSSVDVDYIIQDEEAVDSRYVGELPNGTHFDYREYADREHKISKNAFGYDKSDCFGDVEATTESWLEMANKSPEYLASYAYSAFTDTEKQQLGIEGMSIRDIDNYMSDPNNADGGVMQQRIMQALSKIAHDRENTRYDFYYENGTEDTYYLMFNDKDQNGIMSPDEVEVCYSTRKRNNAAQVDIYRFVDGSWVKVLDLNMPCGFQPNQETPPKDVPEAPSEDPEKPTPKPTPDPEKPTPKPTPDPEKPTPKPKPDPEPTHPTGEEDDDDDDGEEDETPTPTPEKEWGKEGDPNSGPNRKPSDQVNPDSEVSKEENDSTNSGNEGYKDDNEATPGSPSENNGSSESGHSKVIADGADTEGGRSSGGENQGGSEKNGTNENAPSKEQKEKDESGDKAQKKAEDSGNKAGGDNHSDEAEEKAVEEGDF